MEERGARECSLADGIGPGLAGQVVERLDGLLEIRLGREECVRKSLWPVQWGERRYLVEPARLEEFLQQARAGAEPRDSSYGSYLLRVGDERLPVAGEPRIVEIVR